MKKIVILSLLLCVAVFAQNQTKAFYVQYPENLQASYEKELQGVWAKFIRSIYNGKNRDLLLGWSGAIGIDYLENLNLEKNSRNIKELIAIITVSGSNSDVQALNTYNNEIKKLKDKHKSKLEENNIYNTKFYNYLSYISEKLSDMSKASKTPKGEFETTEQYNQRLKKEEQIFKDSSEQRFSEAANVVVFYILREIKGSSIIFEKYNADKEIYNIVLNPLNWGIKQASEIKVSPEEAQNLKNAKKLEISANPSDVYSVNYDLYFTKIEISYENKKYVAEFPKVKNMREIVFRGSELWKENPAVKNIELHFNNAAIPIIAEERAKQEAEEKAKQEAIEQQEAKAKALEAEEKAEEDAVLKAYMEAEAKHRITIAAREKEFAKFNESSEARKKVGTANKKNKKKAESEAKLKQKEWEEAREAANILEKEEKEAIKKLRSLEIPLEERQEKKRRDEFIKKHGQGPG